MEDLKAGDPISAGLSLGMGLALTNYIFQTMKPLGKTAGPLIVCLKCRGRSALENKFCWQCGSAFYPQLTVQCNKCKATVPAMKYCGNCGSQLEE